MYPSTCMLSTQVALTYVLTVQGPQIREDLVFLYQLTIKVNTSQMCPKVNVISTVPEESPVSRLCQVDKAKHHNSASKLNIQQSHLGYTIKIKVTLKQEKIEKGLSVVVHTFTDLCEFTVRDTVSKKNDNNK